MKRVVTITTACLSLYFNGFAQCTPNAPTGNPGLTPVPSSVTCIERGVPYDFTLYFENFSSFNCSGFTADINSATIDNLSNLPCGITWQADQSSYSAGETGCIRITGTSTDVVGQYPLEVTMTFDLDIFGSSYTVSGTIAQLQAQLQQFNCSSPSVNTDYYSRVIDPGNSCPSIGSSSNLISSGITCPPPPAISVSISGNSTICSGSSTTLTANVSNATGAVTYSWNPGGGSGQTVSVSPTSTATYSVTATDQNGSATASVTVTVIQVCDDNDACTSDNCASNSCVFTLNAPCNDNDGCTTDNCVPASGCVFTPNAACNDNDACTTDNCVPATGCVYTPITPCNDNDACTTDNCVPASGCVFTPNAPCNDNDACTTDNCVPATGCVYTPITPCNDNDACTTDNCVPATGCVYTPVICDDGDGCTTDACVNGPCVFTPIPNCTDPCDTLVCDDGDLCTADTCLNGQCEYTAIICDDADTCSTDNCVPATGCVFTPITPCNVGIGNIYNSLSVEISPNPTSGIFEIEFNNIKECSLLLNVFDLSGRNLYSENFKTERRNSKQIDMNGLSKDIYILRLSSEEISINKKLVLY